MTQGQQDKDTTPAEAPAEAGIAQIPYYKEVDAAALTFVAPAWESKGRRVYVANVSPGPLQVRTPPVRLGSGFEPGFAAIEPPAALRAWLLDVEQRMLSQCTEHRNDWFKSGNSGGNGGGVDTDTIIGNFKSFYDAETGTFRVKVPEEPAVYDAAGAPVDPAEFAPGDHVRCVLELKRICFGQTQFGGIWTAVEARAARVKPSALPDADPDTPEDVGTEAPEEGPEEGDAYEDAEDFDEFR